MRTWSFVGTVLHPMLAHEHTSRQADKERVRTFQLLWTLGVDGCRAGNWPGLGADGF
jgi:hypothetical protein